MYETCSDYLEARKALDKGKNLMARRLLEKAMLNSNYSRSALATLVNLNLKEEKYDQARELLENFQKTSTAPYALVDLQALLELNEYNLLASKRYNELALENGNMQVKNMLFLGKSYLQLGDFALAEKFFETLRINENFRFTATMNLVYLYMLQEDYQKAYHFYESVKESSEMSPYYHYVTEAILLFKLKRMNSRIYAMDKDTSYTLNRLFNQNDQELIEHISKHKNEEEQMTNGCFFADLNLARLIDVAKGRIERMNPIYNNTSEFYKMRLDFPVGFKERTITSDVCVIALTGTKIILTIYPIALSNKYNVEQFAEDKNLKMKRLKGGTGK